MIRKIYDTCKKCGGIGTCQPCKGSGRSGFFLTLPGVGSKPCPWCKGSACCDRCQGSGKVVAFAPYICAGHSLRVPASITAAAFTGARWTYIGIPDEALMPGKDAQLAWVAARVREHYRREKGKCPLLGGIIGY